MAHKCPICKDERPVKVIYAGLPMWLCRKEECSAVWGMWAWWIDLVGFDGWFMEYEGPYILALWAWLMRDWEED